LIKFKLIAKKLGDQLQSESNSKVPKWIKICPRGLAEPIRWYYRLFAQVFKFITNNTKKVLGYILGDVADWILKKLLNVINYLMSSTSNFLKAILGIQIVYSLIYLGFAGLANHKLILKKTDPLFLGDYVDYFSTYIYSLISAFKYFFTSETNSGFSRIFNMYPTYSSIVLGTQGALALASLSIFMAMIVSQLTRK
jgi:hypothetical protein